MRDNEFEKYLNEADKELFETVTNYRIFVRELIERYNRQKAEIERYKGVIKILERDVQTAILESRKEFADKLKELPSMKLRENDWVSLLIDRLLEEMEGEGK